MKRIKVTLPDEEIPKAWYNILPDLPKPMLPPLHPATGEPVKAEDLAPIFPMNLIEQEVSDQRWIEIPEAVLEKYLIWRPTPLCRAVNFERFLDAPVRIYYKNEGLSPAGSHKPNTAVPQAYYNKVFGIESLSTETGAGQWGSALSMACSMFGLTCRVFMVKVSYEQKPYRRLMMETWGAQCIPSPSEVTAAGRNVLEQHPDSPGSLGIAISEAIEDALSRPNARYSLGSVLNHVLLHQTIIGLEARKQLEAIGEYPDVVLGCAGGGSNFAGIALPFVRDKIEGRDIRIVGAEPTSCPTMTRGPFAYDFGDLAKTTPLLPMYTLGHDYVPAPIHAGGLRYHGMAPIISHLVKEQIIEARAYHQLETFEAGVNWARAEGYIPAPETDHVIAAVVDEARRAREEGKEKVILFNWSGHGLVDLASYEAYFAGKLLPYELPDEEIERALKAIADFPKAQ
ncbi:MAG TPA: TrpB-like pyridoxal phosphate-dependent enzyme [Syntrophales bacterium]|nr:TrpB-like pyridoxal phosphate-dependent enzyme [Syntrophales bacterium]HOM07025.1 TrpB-like pyridoxal phosphate-dependent enzyme [Syntrophales bacterium]HON99576.1 TrpB-like pyridoxal phosphate-dependent enzyme [Syntrophales bacterium]HPC01068.1 TrpB-like pyridoxal phosphate-dependent enzyme [Syntrophales bacterium]HPQ06793.1 TrpB-like pyridoxal phosphate-dependent enzyme [Syntrophales bacterium]